MKKKKLYWCDMNASEQMEFAKKNGGVKNLLIKDESPGKGPLWINFNKTEKDPIFNEQQPISLPYERREYTWNGKKDVMTKWFKFTKAAKIAKKLNVQLDYC